MSNQKKNFISHTRYILLLKEPYEMTYWKEKLNSPFHKFQMAVKHFLSHMFHKPHRVPSMIRVS